MKRILLTGLLAILCLVDNTFAQRITKRKIEKIFNPSGIVQEHYTGFELYDQEKNKVIYEYNSNKHSVPASNTKLFTFYAALHLLGDSIPGMKYIIKGDSLIFWGTGDPSMLHSEIRSAKVYDFLKNSDKKLFYSAGSYSPSFYREGQTSYNPEITAMPVAENQVTVYAGADLKLRISPALFNDSLRLDTAFHPQTFTVRRSGSGNTFIYPDMPVPAGYSRKIGLRTSPELTVSLLKDTLHKEIGFVKRPLPASAKIVYSIPSDTLYKKMLLPSDNYIAEQLLVLCSSTLPGPLNTDSIISYSIKNYMSDLPDEIRWNDGSGLSRYNLFTPRSIVKLLTNINEKIGSQDRLHELLPAGGVNGTLRNAYKTDNGQPFVWAKTGTLSNVHIQGGYLVTRKGKKLIYSFMNNNFLRPTADIRSEMGRIITEIHNRF
jgi:D-alanyl-D-alanine carboxypeptidase/D-alanyl-D-alanine-endopeptidase (penicillin-binding protein 4)